MEAEPQSDLLRQHYPDLASGRFITVADFEEPEQANLFRIEPERRAGDVRVEPRAGIAATGGTCLRFVLRSPDSKLVVDNSRAKDWVLPRRWRPYNLLLMNVFCPVTHLELSVRITSGSDGRERQSRTDVVMHKGWNLVRLDLNEAAEHVALDDVRELALSAPQVTKPLEFKLDDLLLADNRLTVSGDPDGAEGTLFVVRDGRQFRVGAVDRFELVFSAGQIVRWYATANDPARLNDLVGAGSVLGPVPVILPKAFADGGEVPFPSASPHLGDTVRTEQRVTEANAVRVVIDATWAAEQGDAARQWSYAIYPSGQVFLTVVSTLPKNAGDEVGLLVSRLYEPGLEVTVGRDNGSSESPEPGGQACIGCRDGECASLLFTVQGSPRAAIMQPVSDALDRRLGVVSSGGRLTSDRIKWSGLLSVWSTGACASPDQGAIVGAWEMPAMPDMLAGHLDVETEGDANKDGYNERLGCFIVAPEGNSVQMRIGGGDRPVRWPAFVVRGTAGKEVWVYVNQVVHEPVARDREGNVLFQLGEVVEQPATVEVYVGEAS